MAKNEPPSASMVKDQVGILIVVVVPVIVVRIAASAFSTVD
jgi:hypothetical protein